MTKKTQFSSSSSRSSKSGCPSIQIGERRSARLPSLHVTLLGLLRSTRPPVQTWLTSAVAKSHTARKSCSAWVLMATRLASSSMQASLASSAVSLSFEPSRMYSALRNGVHSRREEARAHGKVRWKVSKQASYKMRELVLVGSRRVPVLLSASAQRPIHVRTLNRRRGGGRLRSRAGRRLGARAIRGVRRRLCGSRACGRRCRRRQELRRCHFTAADRPACHQNARPERANSLAEENGGVAAAREF